MTQIRSSLRAIALGAIVASIPSAATGQAEHRNLSGERVAVYNLAGRVRVQAATGSQVTVDITRGGRDASKLKLETGEVRGWNSLRVVYPSDRIVYPEWQLARAHADPRQFRRHLRRRLQLARPGSRRDPKLRRRPRGPRRPDDRRSEGTADLRPLGRRRRDRLERRRRPSRERCLRRP